MKKILIVMLIVGCFFVVGCYNVPPTTPSLINLEVPNVIKYEENTIYWNSVANCDEYVVKINEMEYNTNLLSYKVSFKETTEFKFQVKAKGRPNYSLDSNWSNVYTYQYIVDQVQELKKIDTPNIIRYDLETNTIYWDAVENAVDYCLKINGEEKNCNLTNYKFNFSDSCEFTLSIKALSKNLEEFLDSDWTAEATYQYTYYRDVSSEEREIARRFGIGYGYNFIDDDYFNPSEIKKTESIIDLDKILRFAEINDDNAYTVESMFYHGESEYDFAVDMNTKLSSNANLEVPIEGVYVGATQKFGLGSNLDISSYAGSCFLTSTTYQTHKIYELTDYGSLEKISNYLSDEFLKLVEKQGDKYSQLTDAEIAKIIVDNYGTHMITGIITGAKLEYYYGMYTKDYEIATGINAEMSMGVSMKIPELIEAQRNLETSLGINTSIAAGYTLTSSKLYVHGGKLSGENYSLNDIESINETISNWLKDITDDNAVALGIKNSGAIAIYDIVYQKNPEIAKCIKEIIDNDISEAINKQENLFKKESYAKIEKGSANNPHLVSSVSDFLNFMNNTDINANDKYIKIISDLDFTGEIYNHSIISDLYANIFADTIENPNTGLQEPYIKITGININLLNRSIGNYGLFENIHTTASVKNLIFENNKIVFKASKDEESIDEARCGILCSTNEGTIINCNFMSNEITLNGQSDSRYQEGVIGTVASINKGCISNCIIDSSVLFVDSDTQNNNVTDRYNTTIAKVGGICGKNEESGSITSVSVQNSNLYGRACYHDYTYRTNDPVCLVGIYVGENFGSIANCIKGNNTRQETYTRYYRYWGYWKNDPSNDTNSDTETGN